MLGSATNQVVHRSRNINQNKNKVERNKERLFLENMATYFHGNNNNNTHSSEIQSSAEGLQTLYLMNPNYVPFSDSAQNPTTQQHHINNNNNNMLLLNNPNNTTSATATHRLSHAPPHHQQHHLLGVTIPASAVEISRYHGFSMAAEAPRAVNYNLWGSINSTHDRTPLSAATGVTVAVSDSSGNSEYPLAAEVGFHGLHHHHQQGLSLSLSSQHPGYRSFSGEMDAVSPASGGVNNNNYNNNNGVSSVHSVVLGSKYLKAAQELLDEVANVGNNNNNNNNNIKGISIIEGSSSNKEKMKGNKIIVESSSGVRDGSSGGNNNDNKQGGELSTAQRQELQLKKSKLVNMLHEVEQRYHQYHHEIQQVISSLEQGAGYGSARSYTSLAVKTISKQFRCLKDAISLQIKATNKLLGEDEDNNNCRSRLKLVDQHLRQERALQQLGMGMMHHHNNHNAWRPQRGLPERAVSLLRAWLFEHFLHPYPKDSDKVMLAKQTGLTRSQVSNWFINARVRLWKPMVEEMYMEEVKDNNNNNQDHNNNNNTTTTSKDDNNNNIAVAAALDQSKPEPSFNQNTTSPAHQISNSNNNNNNYSMSKSPNMGGGHSDNFISVDMEIMNKPNTREETNNTNFGIIDSNHAGASGGYGALLSSMEDIGRFNHHHHQQQQLGARFHGNGVSLTLGLPPSENNNNIQHGGFLSSSSSQNSMHHLGGNNNNENNDQFCVMNSTATTSTPSSHHHSGTSYDLNNNNIDTMQNRKRFASQLLRDFVA